MCTFKAVTQIYIEKKMWEKLIINLIFSPRLKKKKKHLWAKVKLAIHVFITSKLKKKQLF